MKPWLQDWLHVKLAGKQKSPVIISDRHALGVQVMTEQLSAFTEQRRSRGEE
jgi:hypothetical protein